MDRGKSTWWCVLWVFFLSDTLFSVPGIKCPPRTSPSCPVCFLQNKTKKERRKERRPQKRSTEREGERERERERERGGEKRYVRVCAYVHAINVGTERTRTTLKLAGHNKRLKAKPQDPRGKYKSRSTQQKLLATIAAFGSAHPHYSVPVKTITCWGGLPSLMLLADGGRCSAR